jgi:hypothetical protein
MRTKERPLSDGMVIRALVRAKLLGLQLLTLEAQVVVAPGDDDRAVLPAVVVPPDEPAGRARLAAAEPGLERAIELVEQSTATLARTRRPH